MPTTVKGMLDVPKGEIKDAVASFLNMRSDGTLDPAQMPKREHSFDFCFNYFQAHRTPTLDMELSCLQLGYYLASWGMLRGSSYLFRETNARRYAAAIRMIEEANEDMVGLDAHTYGDATAQDTILTTYKALAKALLPDGGDAHHPSHQGDAGRLGRHPCVRHLLHRRIPLARQPRREGGESLLCAEHPLA